MDKREFVNAIFSEREIEFRYKGINYVISKNKNKFAFYSINNYDIKLYNTPKELLENMIIDDRNILDIIENVTDIKVM